MLYINCFTTSLLHIKAFFMLIIDPGSTATLPFWPPRSSWLLSVITRRGENLCLLLMFKLYMVEIFKVKPVRDCSISVILGCVFQLIVIRKPTNCHLEIYLILPCLGLVHLFLNIWNTCTEGLATPARKAPFPNIFFRNASWWPEPCYIWSRKQYHDIWHLIMRTYQIRCCDHQAAEKHFWFRSYKFD